MEVSRFTPWKEGTGKKSPTRRRQVGFTMIELLIVVAIIGILASIAIPQLLTAYRKAHITRLFAEIKGFQRALVQYSIDNSWFPLENEFDKNTLEPLVSAGYLKVNSLTRHLRDNEIHSYKYQVGKGTGKKGKKGKSKALTWHCHPKLPPYDDGPYKVKIEGNESGYIVEYLKQDMGPSQFLALVQ